MNEVPTNIGTVALEGREDVADVVTHFAAAAQARGFSTCDALDGEVPREGLDLIVGIGGDGTLMRAAHIAHEIEVPVIGVNLGTVGYLTEVEPENVDEMLRRLAAGDLGTHARMTVAAELPDGSVLHGINDVAMEKVISQRLVQISVEVNDEFFTTFRSDGLIIATPLGSTAYSLSAGGPIVDPDLDVLIMTPVAPHSLMNRPTIFTPGARLRFTVATERQVRVNLDGHVGGVLEEGESVVVRAGERGVDFLTMGIHPFPQAVRHQFGLDHA
ncbi:MAG: NAD(+)/NADH kinase [Acidimicrobiia bacterium]|nr:NAD(+)/NADH kinase [Acidimicrobiia bacterium]